MFTGGVNGRKRVTIYTDGACSGNPGPGGYAAVLLFGEHRKEIKGSQPVATNNQMELMAAIAGLMALKTPCIVELYSDSAYLINAFEKNWLEKWQQNGWLTAKKQPVENKDLWVILLKLAKDHKINWHKVKGHSDNPENERCDYLAKLAIRHEVYLDGECYNKPHDRMRKF